MSKATCRHCGVKEPICAYCNQPMNHLFEDSYYPKKIVIPYGSNDNYIVYIEIDGVRVKAWWHDTGNSFEYELDPHSVMVQGLHD